MIDIANIKEDSSIGEFCLREFGKATRHLEETVAELCAKLSPICRQEPETNTVTSMEPVPAYSPYFESMRSKTEALSNSTDRLRKLLDLLEI